MDQLSAKIRDSFPTKRIVIGGDLVADQFLHGTIARVSREAPVFILRHDVTDTRAGAAANAAVNIASLGATPVLVGVVGDDENGRLLLESLSFAGVDCRYVITEPSKKTTTKVRVLAGQHYAARQQVIRIDYEDAAEVSPHLRERLMANFAAAAEGADALIVSDYNYGVADEGLFSAASQFSCRAAIPLLIDSRFRLGSFLNATAATPNQEEAEQLIGAELTPENCEELRERLGVCSLLVTRGNKGMMLFQRGAEPVILPAVGSAEPVDVTGAGDTVIAAFTLGLASGLSPAEAAGIANHAGGVVVMKKGTASASADELIESIKVHGAAANVLESSAR